MTLEFWSADGKFGLQIAAAQTRTIITACKAAGRNETGGVLIGTYSADHDCAIVKRVCGPPPDSQFGPTWFFRGVRGVQQVVDQYWRRRTGYYLGEWHFHTFARPELSDLDRRSIRGIAASVLYNCPEPILLLIGGDPAGEWNASAWAFRRGNSPVPLQRNLSSAVGPTL